MSEAEHLSSLLVAICPFFPPYILPVCFYIPMITCLPFCLGTCVSVCLHFCLCPRSCGIVTKCWLHTWQALLPACLAFWGFQALRIPLPGFLSFSLLSLLSSSVFSSFPPISLGLACGALPLCSLTVCESKLLTFGYRRNHQVLDWVFQILLSYYSRSLPPTFSLVNTVLYH